MSRPTQPSRRFGKSGCAQIVDESLADAATRQGRSKRKFSPFAFEMRGNVCGVTSGLVISGRTDAALPCRAFTFRRFAACAVNATTCLREPKRGASFRGQSDSGLYVREQRF